MKIFNLFLKKDKKINPLIGNAGVSAVPMAARISNNLGLEYDPSNYLLMHAMGPNVVSVIGSAVAAGVLLRLSWDNPDSIIERMHYGREDISHILPLFSQIDSCSLTFGELIHA